MNIHLLKYIQSFWIFIQVIISLNYGTNKQQLIYAYSGGDRCGENHGQNAIGFGAGGSSYVSGYQECLAID